MTFPVYPEYKDSGVEWLGKIPSHWQAIKLKNVCHVFPSNVDKHSREGEQQVRLCNYTDVYYNEVITNEMLFMESTATDEQIQRFTLKSGDTIITKDSETADDIAIAAYVPDDLPNVICGYHLSMVRPKDENVSGSFVKRLFDSSYAKSKFAVLANGLTRVGLNQYALDNVSYGVPPISEQHAIVNFLDFETAKIDALIQEQHQLVELLNEKRQSIISNAVCRGLDPDVPLKESGIEWLGMVPEHWQVVPFRLCVDYSEGPGIMAVDFLDSGTPLLRVSCVQGRWATLNGCNFLDPDKVEKRWSHFKLKIGDLLISASASLGTITEVAKETVGAIPYTGLIRLRPKPEMITRSFVRTFVLSSVFTKQIDVLKTGATIQHFGPTHLAQIRMPLPPLEEQLDITSQIEELLESYEHLSDEANLAINLLEERRAALISAAVCGQIDVRSFQS